MSSTLILTDEDVRRVLGVKEANDLVEECFRALGEGSAENLVTTGIGFRDPPGRCNMKSGYLRERKTLGIKIIRVHPKNPMNHDLPVMNCQIVLLNSETGVVLAVMDGVYVTRVRTGAAGAIGARFLSRPDARQVAVIGAGVQGRAQLEALAADRHLGSVFVWSRSPERRESYAKDMSKVLDLEIYPVASIEDACRKAEIIITATWSYEPLIRAEWVQPGTFIAAIGADAAGMQELDPRLLTRSKVVVDDVEQCVKIGEINVPVREGTYRVGQLYGTMGEVAARVKPGRTDPLEVTIFDSTGVGVQDAVVADHAFHQAMARGIGNPVHL